ncbi:MAG: hypothetical protein ACLSBL_01855 [Ezakiella massiliensis]
MTIREKEDLIFDKLKNPDIIKDGLADESQYLSAEYKIIYIMKEVNGGKGWDLRDFIKDGGRSQTWDNIARWTEGILNLDKDYPWDYLKEDNEARRMKYLKKIGAVNLKKLSGTYESIPNEISAAACENKQIIKEQIDLYDPDIIICCGTAVDYVNNCIDPAYKNWQMTRRGIPYIRLANKIIIDHCHPGARFRDSIKYYALVDAVHEILKYTS